MGVCWFGDIFESTNVGRAFLDVDWTAFDFAKYAAAYWWVIFIWFISKGTYTDDDFRNNVPGYAQYVVYVWLCASSFLTYAIY